MSASSSAGGSNPVLKLFKTAAAIKLCLALAFSLVSCTGAFLYFEVGIRQEHLDNQFESLGAIIDGWRHMSLATWDLNPVAMINAFFTNMKYVSWQLVGPLVIGGPIAFWGIHPVVGILWIGGIVVLWIIGVLGPWSIPIIGILAVIVAVCKLIASIWPAGAEEEWA